MADNQNEDKNSSTPKKSASVKKASRKKATAKKAATSKSTAKKSAAVKRAPVKKAAVKKKTATPAKTADPAAKSAAENAEALQLITQLVAAQQQENQNRDRQMADLVTEVTKGFERFSVQAASSESERDQEMARLYQNLDGAFNKASETDREQDERTMTVVKALSESIMRDHEQTLKEFQEQKKLQDKKIEHLTKLQEQRHGRNRWIAIPAVIIAIIAVIYMVHVVRVMETAMSSMSGDMQTMNASVQNMSNKMNVISLDTSSMNTNMQQLNRSMQQMSRDLNVMTHNVVPTMRGMGDLMPWK